MKSLKSGCETTSPEKSLFPFLKNPSFLENLHFNSGFVVVMAETEIIVICYWKSCIKYGTDGVYYEQESTTPPKRIRVKQKTALSKLLDGLYQIIGVDKQRSKIEIFGRCPVVVSPNQLTYMHLPVVNDGSLETMLEVPSNHPCIKNVELYLEVKSTFGDDVIVDPAACSSPLEIPGSSLKRQRTQEPRETSGCKDTVVAHPLVKDEANVNFGNGSTSTSTHGGGNGAAVAQAVNNGNAHKDLNVAGLEAWAKACSKPRFLSSLWVDDHELRAGLCFKDRDELKKAVDWCSMRGRKKCVVRETGKDEYTFKCVRRKCNWYVRAVARMEGEDGVVEITKCSGPHSCSPIEPDNFNVEFAAEVIESLIRVRPTVTIAELKDWWFEKFGKKPETSVMRVAKKEVIQKVYGNWDQSFIVLPKLMAALHSSNGLIVDLQYDLFPNPEFASFSGMFWAFPQSIEGFQHCRPLIIVDTKDLNNNCEYPMKFMIASGLDADGCYFPVAFAVTKEVSSDTWRWFLARIRQVTQRKGLCLMSSLHPDILDVINEPGSMWQEPWGYHIFCLDDLCSRFHDVFQDYHLKSLVKKAGSTSEKDEFDSHMETIKKKNLEARQWLDQMSPHQWALAHDNGLRYGSTSVNNIFRICERFGHLSLSVPAFALLLFDELRMDFYKSLCDSSNKLNHGYMYTSAVVEKHKKLMAASVTHIVNPLDKDVFQVTEALQKKDDRWIVKLSERSCTCGEFTSKFPCLHALAVCEKLRMNPLKYVDDCYSIERLYKTYAATFNPVPEVSVWPEAPGVPTLFPPVIPQPQPPTNE